MVDPDQRQTTETSYDPAISGEIMELHHGKHHQAYVTNLNAALEKYPDLQSKSGIWGMKLNRQAYTAGVLRGGISFNVAAAQAIGAEKAK